MCHCILSIFRGPFPALRNIANHGHDTYGLGVANALAAIEGGATAIDASFAGLGGCPFAPGATGNVATEDVVWTLDRMGLSTGIALALLLEASGTGADPIGSAPCWDSMCPYGSITVAAGPINKQKTNN